MKLQMQGKPRLRSPAFGPTHRGAGARVGPGLQQQPQALRRGAPVSVRREAERRDPAGRGRLRVRARGQERGQALRAAGVGGQVEGGYPVLWCGCGFGLCVCGE